MLVFFVGHFKVFMVLLVYMEFSVKFIFFLFCMWDGQKDYFFFIAILFLVH